MHLHKRSPGSWFFNTEVHAPEESVKIVLYARGPDGEDLPTVPPDLLKRALEIEAEAPKLRGVYKQAIISTYVDPAGLEDVELDAIGVSVLEIRRRDSTAIKALQDRVRLLYIAIKLFPDGGICVYGQVVDPWLRVWEVAEGYIEGWNHLKEFET